MFVRRTGISWGGRVDAGVDGFVLLVQKMFYRAQLFEDRLALNPGILTWGFQWLDWRYCGLITFFRINNIELKCSFVRCQKYHKSWWNGAHELHISVDLLCGTTAAELHNSIDFLCGTTAAELRNSVDLLCGTTDAELHNLVNILCGTTAAELNNPFWCMHQESHAFSKEKYEGFIQSKILLRVFYFSKLLKDERFGRFSKHRSIVDP